MAKSISKKNSWLSVVNSMDPKEPVELRINGTIGPSIWDESGISAKDFNESLADIPNEKNIVVCINSEGGSVADGLAIYNALRRRGDGKVSTRVDGYAVSIASVIALAGGKRISPKSSIWMIHEPWAMAAGNAEDMRKMAAALEVHAESIVSIYSERTGLNANAAREKMRAETWFRGEEAKTMGFATDVNEEAVAFNAIDFTKFQNVPKDILKNLVGPTKADTQPATAQAECIPITVAPTPISAAEEAGNPKEKTTAEHAETKGNKMPETAIPTAAAAPPANPNAELLEKFNAMEQKIAALSAPPLTQPRPLIKPSDCNEGLQDLLATKGDCASQYNFLKRNWSQLKNSYPMFPVRNANTDSASGALTTAILVKGSMTVLQNRLAYLGAFVRNLTQGRIGRNALYLPKVTAGGTAQSNPTSFQDTTNFVSTVGSVTATPAHIVAGAHVTNAELQSGWDISWFVDIKSAEFADKIAALVNAIITTGNFTATPVTSNAILFRDTEAKTLWGQLKKSPIKNLILDGEYYAQFLPSTTQNFNPLATNTYPGWDGFFLHTNWSGATTNTVGFACNPQAIGVGAGLPVEAPNMLGAGNLTENVITLENNGMQVSNFMWFDPSTRNIWWTLEAMFAAGAGDTTAGVLVLSA